MKNRLFERHRKLQKIYGSKPNQRLEQGIVVRHLYGEYHDHDKSWWDDTGFNLNGTRISIWWTHPRLDFSDAIETMAYENIPYPDTKEPGLFDNATKIYKKVGKSGKRKKLSGYKSGNERSAAISVWYKALREEEARLKKETDLVIRPHFKVTSYDWCRGVSICCPMEVHSVADLKKLCDLVKALLKGTTTLDKEFPNYQYTKENWISENNGLESKLFSHAVA